MRAADADRRASDAQPQREPLLHATVRSSLWIADVASCVALVVLIGLADSLTGAEIDFAVVYVVPIAWSTWRVSRAAGIAVAVGSAVLALWVDVHLGRYRVAPFPVAWKVAVETALFGVCIATVDRIRRAVVAESRLLGKLENAYDQIDQEVQAVADIQRMMLPAWTPKVRDCDIAVHYATSLRAGGDYYDFLVLPDGRLGLLVADASGHGPSAAVLMAMFRALVHANPELHGRPNDLLEQTNRRLVASMLAQHFVTAICAVFDPATRVLEFALAGHPPPLLRHEGRAAEVGQPTGPPIGISVDSSYPSQSVTLSPGDVMVLYTDGLTEARGPGGEVLGVEEVLRSLASAPGGGARKAVSHLLRVLDSHTAAAPREDDVTILAIAVGPTPGPTPAAS